MKKKIWIPILIAVVLAVLFIPIPTGVYKDGGTKEFTALTYKIVDWNRITDDGIYSKTKIYFLPYNFKSIDGLWYYEKDNTENSFEATVIKNNGASVIVEPFPDEIELGSSDQIVFNTASLNKINVKAGDFVKVTYTGAIAESYPAQINAVSWEKIEDLQKQEYTKSWVDKIEKNKWNKDTELPDLIITKIYSNCFFAEPATSFPYQIKLNGKLSEQWCIGDQVACDYANAYCDERTMRFEADLISIEEGSFNPNDFVAYKPVIYLYPEKETEVSVSLDLNGSLICTYPDYKNGWQVTAAPDGTLRDKNGQTYNYLYWEADLKADYDVSKGFCVKGEDTAAFLEGALSKLGLTRREANEFIVYWLPQMQQNPYNIISFQTRAYTDAARLNVNPAPDMLIRVFMTFKASESYVEIPIQSLTAPERDGFTVVEWGGTQVK